MSYREVSEIRDGMQIDWDVPIEMDDGLVLRADVFRPIKKGRYPVIFSHGPYAKWLHFEDGYKTAWKRMEEKHPDVMGNSTNKYASWEVCDPEKWVPHGYVCVRVDSGRQLCDGEDVGKLPALGGASDRAAAALFSGRQAGGIR